ncbi:MAG: DUF4406 domain-containing protein, partial [Hungatella sp.]
VILLWKKNNRQQEQDPLHGQIVEDNVKNKSAYICSPYRGNIFKRIRNIRYARQLTRNAIRLGFTPITPHLYLTQVLNDKKPTERIEGMAAALDLLSECSTLIVGMRYGVSSGMKTEIERARLNGITIIGIWR